MSGCALYGTSFTELRRQAFEWIDNHAGTTPESAVLLEENDYQRDTMGAAWRADYSGLRLTISDFASFGQTAHERLFGPYPDIGTVERQRLIEQSLQTAETPDGIDTPRQHTDSVSELFRKLEADGLQTTEELRTWLEGTTCSKAQRELLISTYEQYQQLADDLTHPDALPRNEKLAAVADSDESLQDAFPYLDAVVVSGVSDPSSVEIELLERLATTFPVLVLVPMTTPEAPATTVDTGITGIVEAVDQLGFETKSITPDETGATGSLAEPARRLYRSVPTPDTPPKKLSWHEAPTPDREITHLARRLRDRLATGSVDPDEILVLAPGLLSYRDGLADTFAAYDIDYAYQVSILLERTYVGQAVLEAMSLCERPNSTQLSHLATNPLVSLQGIDSAEVADTHRRLYTTAIDPFVAELDESEAGVRTLLAHAETVRTASAAELRAAIESLFEYLNVEDALESFDADTDIDIGYESRAFGQVQQILDSVERVCETLSPTNPLAEAIEALEGVRVTPPPQAADGSIEIIGLQDTPMAEFEDLYILGATAGQLSGQTTRPRFFQEIGEELAVFEPNEHRDITRYRFGVLLANANRAHITTPETTIDDESLLASPLVDELARVTGLEKTTGIDDERRGSREDLQRAMAGAKPEQLESALASANNNGAVSDTFVTATTRGATCAYHRGENQLSAHDGQLTPAAMTHLDDSLNAYPFSHSRLSNYAKCGFKYLLSKGWSFDEEDDIEPGVSNLTVGSIIHETVESFYKTVQTHVDNAGPVDLTTIDQSVLEQQLLEAGLAAVEDANETFDDAFAMATLQRLFSGLATPAVNQYYSADTTSTDPPNGTFKLFLQQELERASNGHRPTAFEDEFGSESGITLSEGRHLPIHGIIDRIDETAEGGVTIFDYKSSSTRRTRGREDNARDGLDFQLPGYTLGTPSLLSGHSTLSPIDIDARYYILNDNPEVKLRNPLSERFDFDYEAFLTETVPQRIDELAEAIDAGAFQPALVGADTAGCEYCAFRDICDVRHHRRYDIIEAIDDHNDMAYVPDGARSEDVVEQLPGGEINE